MTIDPRGVIAREWKEFERRILDPIHAGQTQRSEMRRAFYAGAMTMFTTMTDLAGPDDEDDAIGAARVEVVHQELQRFYVDVQHGRA